MLLLALAVLAIHASAQPAPSVGEQDSLVAAGVIPDTADTVSELAELQVAYGSTNVTAGVELPIQLPQLLVCPAG